MNNNLTQFWNITSSGKEAEIDIYGEIGDISSFDGQSVSAMNFIKDLRGLGRGINKLNINVHSVGGSVADALAIYRALVDFQAEKVVHVSAIAASAATIVALGGDRIEVAPEAEWMIHNPLAGLFGYYDAKMTSQIGELLEKCKEQILNIYERKTGSDRDHLSDMMDAETYFYGEEIKEAGFADVVKKDTPKVRVAASMCVSERLMKIMKKPPQLKPAPVSAETQARIDKLKAFNG